MSRRTFNEREVMEAKSVLAGLPAKGDGKKPTALPALVKAMRGEIRAALNAGWTIEEIAAALATNGFEIAAPTLKSYFYKCQKAKKKAAGGGRIGGRRTSPVAPAAKSQDTSKAPSAANQFKIGDRL